MHVALTRFLSRPETALRASHIASPSTLSWVPTDRGGSPRSARPLADEPPRTDKGTLGTHHNLSHGELLAKFGLGGSPPRYAGAQRDRGGRCNQRADAAMS